MRWRSRLEDANAGRLQGRALQTLTLAALTPTEQHQAVSREWLPLWLRGGAVCVCACLSVGLSRNENRTVMWGTSRIWGC